METTNQPSTVANVHQADNSNKKQWTTPSHEKIEVASDKTLLSVMGLDPHS